jgi:hypothetical protein
MKSHGFKKSRTVPGRIKFISPASSIIASRKGRNDRKMRRGSSGGFDYWHFCGKFWRFDPRNVVNQESPAIVPSRRTEPIMCYHRLWFTACIETSPSGQWNLFTETGEKWPNMADIVRLSSSRWHRHIYVHWNQDQLVKKAPRKSMWLSHSLLGRS